MNLLQKIYQARVRLSRNYIPLTVQINVNGFRMNCWYNQNLTKELILKGVYEAPVIQQMDYYLSPDVMFLDVGANIGYHSLMASRKTKSIIAFEPYYPNLRLFKQNCLMNNVRPRIFHVAISDYHGLGELYIHDHFGQHSLVNPSAIISVVDVRRLDSFEIFDKKLVIKIDTEGSDLNAVQSLGEFDFKWMVLIVEDQTAAAWIAENYQCSVRKIGRNYISGVIRNEF